MHREGRRRSILKAITYRFVSIMLDSAVAFVITKNAETTLLIVATTNAISIVMYFVHERVWNRVPWGRNTVVSNKV